MTTKENKRETSCNYRYEW